MSCWCSVRGAGTTAGLQKGRQRIPPGKGGIAQVMHEEARQKKSEGHKRAGQNCKPPKERSDVQDALWGMWNSVKGKKLTVRGGRI